MERHDSIETTEDGVQQEFPFWFGDQVGRGLHYLSLLNLPHAPKGTKFVECAGLWGADAWWALRNLGMAELVDEDCIQAAFRLLRTTSKRWPALQTFLHYITDEIQRRQFALAGDTA